VTHTCLAAISCDGAHLHNVYSLTLTCRYYEDGGCRVLLSCLTIGMWRL